MNLRGELASFLGVNRVDRHKKYLGLPAVIGRSNKLVFHSIEERICKKLNGWKEKLLSEAGKEILIKSVALSQHI